MGSSCNPIVGYKINFKSCQIKPVFSTQEVGNDNEPFLDQAGSVQHLPS